MERPKSEKWQKARAFGSRSTRFLRRSTSIVLACALWLFLTQFLLAFVHPHDDGKSLSGEIQTLTGKVQIPFERVMGFDMRYEFPDASVDFMPFLIFVVLLVVRNRADALLLWVEKSLKGTQRKSRPAARTRDLEPSRSGPIGERHPDIRRAREDGRAALNTKILSLYSD